MKILGVLLVSISSTFSTLAQSTSQSPAGAIWLDPPANLIARAIDDGFSSRKLPKNERYHEILNWMKPAIDSRMVVIPPLFCALQMGQTAHDKLLPKPSVDSVIQACKGRITVTFVHYSQALSANWPCVLMKGDTTLQPTVKVPDANPQVAKYYAGFIGGDQVGYRYVDIYSFNLPPDWATSPVTLTYANELGNHGSFTLDFSSFEDDVAGRLKP